MKNKIKHTPKHWEKIEHSWSDTSIVDPDGSTICKLSIINEATEENQQDLEWQMDVNADLIAAAPEMLEALEMIRDADNDCKKDGLKTIPRIARQKIDAAIDKTKGQK